MGRPKTAESSHYWSGQYPQLLTPLHNTWVAPKHIFLVCYCLPGALGWVWLTRLEVPPLFLPAVPGWGMSAFVSSNGFHDKGKESALLMVTTTKRFLFSFVKRWIKSITIKMSSLPFYMKPSPVFVEFCPCFGPSGEGKCKPADSASESLPA